MNSNIVQTIGILSATAAFTRLMIKRAFHRSVTRGRFPGARRTNDYDQFHSKYNVPNQYSYLEDPDCEETSKFVEKQNIHSKKYLSKVETIPKLRERMKDLYNYPKFGTPFKRGSYLFFFENDGLEA